MVSLSTPSFAHLKEKDFENVYEPAEDTFLMMDALEKDYKTILESKYAALISETSRLSLIIVCLLEFNQLYKNVNKLEPIPDSKS